MPKFDYVPANPDEVIVPQQLKRAQSFFSDTEIDESALKTDQERRLDVMKFGLPGVILAGGSTVAELLPGIDSESTQRFAEMIGPNFGEFYKENEAGLSIMGDLGTSFIPAIGAVKLSRSPKVFNAVRNTFGKKTARTLLPTSHASEAALMESIRRRSFTLAGKGQRSFLAGTDAKLDNLTSTSRKLAFTNNLKEGIYADLAVAASMNQSQFIFPDELSMTEHALFFAVPTLGIGGGAWAATRFKIKDTLRQAGSALEEFANSSGAPLEDVIFRPGTRGTGVSVYGMEANHKRAMTQTHAQDDTMLTNLKAEINQLDLKARDQIKNMGTDNIYPGYTTNVELSQAELNTVVNGWKSDELLTADVFSIERFVPEKIEELAGKRTAHLKKLQDQHDELLSRLQSAKDKGDVPAVKIDGMIENIDKLKTQIDDIRHSSAYVLETDGSLTRLSQRKPHFSELSDSKITTDSKLVPEGMVGYKATFKQDGKQKSILVRSDFDIAIPQDTETIQGVNVTKILKDPVKEAELPENTRLLLQDIGKEYHVKREKGLEIFNNLSRDAQNDIHNWIGMPAGTRLRKAEPNDPIIEEIYQAYEPLRARLRELAGPDGTIPLLRGESAKETINPTNDIVSFTANPSIARKFGMSGNVIVKRVSPEDVVAVVGGANDEWEFLVRGNSIRNLIGDTPTNSTFEALTTVGKTAVYEAGKRAIKNFASSSDKIHITPSAHHTKMDMVLELFDKADDPAEVMTRIKADGWHPHGSQAIEQADFIESLEFNSLAGKYREFVRQLDLNGVADEGLLKLPKGARTTIDDIIVGLNLPNDGLGGAHPVIEVFSDLYHAGYKELDEVFFDLDMVREGVKKVVGGTTDDTLNPSFSFRGSQLRVIEEERSPVVMFSRGNYMKPTSKDELISRVFMQRMEQMERLASASQRGAPLVEAALKDIQTTPEAFSAAKNVSGLIEGTQLRKDRFVQIMSTLDNNPTFVAVDNISDRIDKQTLEFTKSSFREHTDTFNKIMSHNNAGDMTSFAMTRNALGHGWRVDPSPVPISEGGKVVGYRYKLMDHAFNKKKWKEIFDEEMPDEAFMPGPATAKTGFSREPLTVTPLANDTLQAVTKLSHRYLDHVNELRVAQGRKPIPKKPMHVPPKRLTDQETVYIIDQNTGKPISLATGKTQAQAMRQAEQDIEIARKEAIAQGKEPPQYFRATQDDVGAFHDLQDSAFGLIDDFTNPLRQTGAAKGTSFGESIEVGPQVLQDIINTLSRNYNRLGKQIKTTIFEPELRQAEIAKASAGLTKEVLADQRTIWDAYVNRVLGVASNNKNQTIGKLYSQIEDTFDHKLQRLWDNHLGVLAGPKRAQAAAKQQFDDLDAKLGKYNPFKDMVDYAENTLNVRTPPSFRKIMGGAAEITTLAMLRFMEVGLAVINLISLPALVPSVAAAIKRRPGQSVDDWKNSIGAWATPLDDDKALWNPVRAATSGIHFMFNDPERKWMLQQAAKRGMLLQEVAERMDLLTSPAQGYAQKMVRDKAKMLSFLVDKSEGMSRTISFSIFYNMARKNMGLTKEASLAFAHRQANQVIGDFRPNVKPQIFQGAVGMPFGLFTTFAWNYFQRMFSYIERRQFGALMNGMGAQAAMFGMSSLPGFNQFVERFTDNYDGTHNLVDRLQEGFGTEATDALLYGSVGALTGLAVSTRADIQLPGSNMYNIYSASPTISLLRNTYGMIRDSVKSVESSEGINPQRQAEIIATQFPIRTIRNIFELGLGESVDRQGRLINENTRTLNSIAGRVSGFKTLEEHKTIMEFSRIRSEQARQADIREQLRHDLRSSFRAGKLDSDSLNTAIENYMLSGGDPASFAQFMRDQAISGLVEKTYLETLSAAADKSRQDNDFVRLMDLLNGK